MKKQLTIIVLLCSLCSSAQQMIPLNRDWLFIKGDSSAGQQNWQRVQLPHTWNAEDVMDDEPGYFRGACFYRRQLVWKSSWKNKGLSLYFEGANQETEVFVNQHKAGRHVGGYTGFFVDITRYLHSGANEIVVKVDNRYNESIAPLSADFSFYGGIYRDLFLVVTNGIHFSHDQGSRGVFITTPAVSNERASVHVKSFVSNETQRREKITIHTTIFSREGIAIAGRSSHVTISSLSSGMAAQEMPVIERPHLWSPEDPYLYRVVTKIISASGLLLDEYTHPLGFRWFRFDADKGFYLNGMPCKLIGASRHQDYQGLGNAVPDSIAVRDVVLLKQMGANFLRVAHYPQDPAVLRACDSLGILASVEIPVVNEITETAAFYRNCEDMLVEMIHQNMNHPSVILWCYMNEVLLRAHFANDKNRQQVYYSNIQKLARRLEERARLEDPYRYTFMANHGNLEQYKKAGLLEIPQVIGWNLYSGWYGGTLQEFPLFLDEFHRSWPTQPFLVAEYGADADPRIRNDQPQRFDKSVEYTTLFHQFYLTEILKRPFVSGSVVWNLADFNSETRTETMPHMNNKGLLEWDRSPKDPYYYYVAVLSKQPFVKILGAGRDHYGIADSNAGVCYIPVQVASNLDSVRIILNGQEQVRLKLVNGLCEYRLPFINGRNELLAEPCDGRQQPADRVVMNVRLQPACLMDTVFPLRQMNIMLGSSRYFIDQNGAWWQPDREYRKGYWGSLGGTRFRMPDHSRLPYGTDKNIIGTNDDPIYQTQTTGIQQYRFDIPPGRYQVSLHFAELLGGIVKLPPYNLSDDVRKEEIRQRIFNVKINGRIFLDHFNIAKDYGLAKPVVKSVTVLVTDNRGICIDFEPVEGEPVLNALQLKRIE